MSTVRLRFSTRTEGKSASLVHLTVVETVRYGTSVRRRGDALCRSRSSLPNLEVLDRQVLSDRKVCAECVGVMKKLRVKSHIELPISAGVVAGDLIRISETQIE